MALYPAGLRRPLPGRSRPRVIAPAAEDEPPPPPDTSMPPHLLIQPNFFARLAALIRSF